MDGDVFARRLEKFREIMRRKDLDTVLVGVPENRYYLSGFEAEDLTPTESSGHLLISEDKQYLLTDFRYEEEARKQAPLFETRIYRDGMHTILPDLFQEIGSIQVAVEEHVITLATFRKVEKALAESRPSARTVPEEDLVEPLRWIKEPEEVDRIRASLAVTEKVLLEVWNGLQPGMKEKDVAWWIERRVREQGAESVSFPPIVGSGPNGALPHAVPTDRGIRAGDAVVIDMGSRLDKYCSDMTRTWIAGNPDSKLKEIYARVREAQQAGIEAARAGAKASEVDRAARKVIEKAGYGDYFGHGLGHGVGIAVHEKPGLRKTGEMVLQENMIVTIEPGIYIPDFQGVRLENMVRIAADGCEVLNGLDLFYPREG